MVGVAGKSQACNTCRKRRVKCDLGRPSCLKCTTSNRACTGYDRDLIFVNRTPSDPSSTATSVLSQIKAQQRLKDAKKEADLHHLFTESSHKSRDFRHYAVELLEAIYLPKKPVSSSYNTKTSGGGFSWVYCLKDLVAPSKSLNTALFAFCLVQLHITGAGNASLYECLDQYNTALQHLYADLADPERQFLEETLAAILVLSTCELFVCPTENGWSVHARGIAEILRLRDQRMASTPAWRHLFSRLRIVCTLEALTKRQADFLENNIWRQIVNESNLDDALGEVYQMIADIPTLLEQVVSLPSIGDRNILLKESADIVRSILAKVKSIKSWYDNFWKNSPTPRSWLVPSCASNLADVDPTNKVFSSCFEFESLSVAATVVMCWSVAAQLYSNVIQIHSLVQARLDRHIALEDLLAQVDTTVVDASSRLEASSQNTLLREIQSEGTKMARNICQSMEYYHRIEMGTYGSHGITYPSWSARQYFRLHPGHEQEWSWLQNMHKMEGPGTRWGLSTMAFADIVEPLGGWSR
ncbi:hypothetical protein ONS95_014537 [Cadophora gregata]|uniref:uncharacterized protein n=1 Tax=Cadophora gregata TaxID=51156 RepID=UPI0026DCABB5|nr:uncharacterized protein ONS95_014537 [Cadophora gregata]KAK0112808.1 hypothetical protein ONS95_014537 [Cadophora gregata]KAK0124939.1 hypothetical protein ONS96_008814 [Cadophora gregata f. sp. sojae]